MKRQQRGVDDVLRGLPQVKEQKWPGTVMAIAIFISLFTLLWLGRRTFIDIVTLLRWLAVWCIVGTLLPYGWSGLRLGMEKLEWFLFNVVAIGPLSISVMLAVNHYVHGPVRWTEARMNTLVVVTTEDDGAITEHRLQSDYFYFTEEEQDASTSKRFRVGIAHGCLGYWSITDVEALP